ncbi:MAG: DUF3179 domain-containing protein [Candidatus Rokubacteria bacterium]|nr:DUF3179 domain-containing protein [Candidatus Rokubacteria bacterium]
MRPLVVALVILLEAVPASAQRLTLLSVPEPIDGTPVYVALAPDVIRAIDEPKFAAGAAAERQMARDEHVLGVRLAGVARAYPLGHLSAHEIVNDRFGDTPVAVTW